MCHSSQAPRMYIPPPGSNAFAFLQMYRELPVLWNRHHPDFKNKGARIEAENKMMKAFGFGTPRELRTKIRSYRSTYTSEIVKINRSIQNGADESTVHKPRLAWFDLDDSFLWINFEDGLKDKSGMQGDLGHYYDGDVRDFTEQADPGDGDADESYQTTPDMVIVKNEIQPTVRRPSDSASATSSNTDKRRRASVVVQPDTSYIQQSAEELLGASEFMVFGQHVAIQLEKLPIREAVKVQQKMQTLLTEARLKSLGSADTLKAECVDQQDQHDTISSEIEES